MISLVISSYCPKLKWLFEALDSARGFDEIVLYCRGGIDRFAENMSFGEREVGEVSDAKKSEEMAFQVRAYVEKHPEKNIRFYTDCVTRFGSDGMNYAAGLAKGEWIVPFSDDDRFITDNLFEAILKIRDGKYDDADIVFSRVTVNDNEIWGIGTDDFGIDRLLEDNAVPFSSFIKKESFFKAGGYLSNDPILDWGLWLRAKMLGMKFRYFEKPIYDYRYTEHATLNVMNGKYGDFGQMRNIIVKNAREYCERASINA